MPSAEVFDIAELAAEADHAVELDALRARMGVILDAIADGVLTVDLDARVDVANPAAGALLYAREPALRGRDADAVLGRHPDADHPSLRELVSAGSRYEAQETFVRADGSTIPVEVTVSPLLVAGVVVGAVVVFRDITERLAATEQLARLATHDRVTGLLNRAGFEPKLQAAIGGDRRADDHAALLFCDLDGFKGVNDTHGHEAGDEVLRVVGERVVACVRDDDLVARLGGDEFVVLLRHTQPSVDAHAVARRIERAVSEPIQYHGVDLRVGVSVGVAYARSGQHAAAVLREADEAMYERKRARKRGTDTTWRTPRAVGPATEPTFPS